MFAPRKRDVAARRYARVRVTVDLLIAPHSRTNTKKLFTDIRDILDESFDEQSKVVKVTKIPFTSSDLRFIKECAENAD